MEGRLRYSVPVILSAALVYRYSPMASLLVAGLGLGLVFSDCRGKPGIIASSAGILLAAFAASSLAGTRLFLDLGISLFAGRVLAFLLPWDEAWLVALMALLVLYADYRSPLLGVVLIVLAATYSVKVAQSLGPPAIVLEGGKAGPLLKDTGELEEVEKAVSRFVEAGDPVPLIEYLVAYGPESAGRERTEEALRIITSYCPRKSPLKGLERAEVRRRARLVEEIIDLLGGGE